MRFVICNSHPLSHKLRVLLKTWEALSKWLKQPREFKCHKAPTWNETAPTGGSTGFAHWFSQITECLGVIVDLALELVALPVTCEIYLHSLYLWASLVDQTVKNLLAVQGTWVRNISWIKQSYPLQYACLENYTDRGAWQATVHVVAKNRTQLSLFSICSCSHNMGNIFQSLKINLWEVTQL